MRRFARTCSASKEQLLRHMEDVRRAEHDLRHHLHALYGLAQADGSKTVQEYISALQMAEEPQGILPCANTALSAVLNYYLPARLLPV